MIICHHYVQDSEVIGIGPLMSLQSPEEAMRLLYNSFQLHFWLHFRNHSFKVESEWFQLGNGQTEFEKNQQRLYNEYKKLYDDAKQALSFFIANN
ncbi:MAG: hypothetical protein ABI921_00540 [Panacibacter sp.]